METIWKWQWKVDQGMQANLEGYMYKPILGFLLWRLQETTVFQPIIYPSNFFSDFEWVFDGLIFNENFQSKVEN